MRNRPAVQPGGSNDQLTGGSPSTIAPNPVAVARIRGALGLMVWTHDGHRSSTRCYQTTRAAQRAAERAQGRGQHVSVVLVRYEPLVTVIDPLQLVLDDDQDGAA